MTDSPMKIAHLLMVPLLTSCATMDVGGPVPPTLGQMELAKRNTAPPTREIIDNSEVPDIHQINNTQIINQTQRNTQINTWLIDIYR